MTRFLGIIIAVVGLGAAIYTAKNKWTESQTEHQREQAFSKLRGDYLERVAWIRNVPDQKAYTDEVQTFFRWYFKEVTEHLNKYGGNRKFDDYLTEMDRKAGKDDSDKSAEKKAKFDYTMKVFESFKSGSYAPYWTGTSNGIRLDIGTPTTVSINGEQKFHLPIVAWGLPREERTDDRGVRRVVVSGGFKQNWKFTDEKGKFLFEMPVEGGPDSRVDWPERFIKFFPPMIVIGHFDIDKVPFEAKTVEISMSISGRSPSGGDVNASYTWKLDVPAEWKLPQGAEWKGAQDSIRPEDEIDPSKKAKK